MSRLVKSLGMTAFLCFSGADLIADDASISVTEHDTSAVNAPGHYALGETASEEQIAGWDIDVRPDGLGLPPGGASAEDGEMLYEDKCASCHGSFGEGVGRYPVIAGGEDTLTEPRPEKTVGSFWPYASTLWDYIHRAMPFTEPESLSDDEVYALTAYVLYLNDLIEYDYQLTQENLADIEMPNQDGFYLDDRPDVIAKRCMTNCKEPGSIEITSEQEPPEIEAETADEVVSVAPGQETYEKACALCHTSGVGNAPIPGDAAAWKDRLAAGRDAMVSNALAGIGIMPPKGGQSQLSDEEVAAAVDFIISKTAN